METKPEEEEAVAAAAGDKKSKGMTGYMLFLQRNREQLKLELNGGGGKGVAEVTKLAAERWRALGEEEKQRWNAEGKLAPTREKPATANASSATTAVAIPPSKVREICKLDREVRAVNGEAVGLLAAATERFLHELATLAAEKAASKRQVKLVDVHHAVHLQDDKFGFLVMDFDTPAEVEAREFQANKRRRQAKLEEKKSIQVAEAPQPANLLTGYFTKKA
ncbi:hypothetical protein BASA81_001033 [Batrachochytrium salamandrivorans]|nr:hypothetical protein BASA81_001033 [Batrachochytrium salamandrivorans]